MSSFHDVCTKIVQEKTQDLYMYRFASAFSWCTYMTHTVILLMEENLHQLICTFSHYYRFYTSQVVSRISAIDNIDRKTHLSFGPRYPKRSLQAMHMKRNKLTLQKPLEQRKAWLFCCLPGCRLPLVLGTMKSFMIDLIGWGRVGKELFFFLWLTCLEGKMLEYLA